MRTSSRGQHVYVVKVSKGRANSYLHTEAIVRRRSVEFAVGQQRVDVTVAELSHELKVPGLLGRGEEDERKEGEKRVYFTLFRTSHQFVQQHPIPSHTTLAGTPPYGQTPLTTTTPAALVMLHLTANAMRAGYCTLRR